MNIYKGKSNNITITKAGKCASFPIINISKKY